jgi:hypothetical protein
MCEQTLGQRKSVRLCYFLRIKKSSLGIHTPRRPQKGSSQNRGSAKRKRTAVRHPAGGPQVTRYQTFGGNLRAHFAAAVRINREKRLSSTHNICENAHFVVSQFRWARVIADLVSVSAYQLAQVALAILWTNMCI